MHKLSRPGIQELYEADTRQAAHVPQNSRELPVYLHSGYPTSPGTQWNGDGSTSICHASHIDFEEV